MAFRIGQKVVCTRDGWSNICNSQPISVPRAGVEYIIRTIENNSGCQSFRFHWLINPKYNYQIGGYSEAQFTLIGEDGIANFRMPLETTTETGMSILREILDRESHDERKPARV